MSKTDAEREAQIRRHLILPHSSSDAIRFLRLLDEARAERDLADRSHQQTEESMSAEIARLTQERDDYRADYLRVHKDKMDILDERLAAAPPEADVIKLAERLWLDGMAATPWERLSTVARALTAYGNQRAREARAAAIEEAAHLLDKNAALYEQAHQADPYANLSLRSEVLTAAVKRIRALPDAPPQSEGG